MTSSSFEFEPPIREIVVFQPETFPLHRWDNNTPVAPRAPRRRVRTTGPSDLLPKLPFRSKTKKSLNVLLNSSITSGTGSLNSDDMLPRCPARRVSIPRKQEDPRFLATAAAGPCRRPPSRTESYHHHMDLHEIPLKRISFDEGNKEVKEQTIAQPLQEVVMDRCQKSHNAVNVLFAIRRPGCGQCREHGMQLAEICKNNPAVTLTGVLKETIGIHQSIFDFYSKYFTFPLYKDEGWNLYHTIGNKKLSLFKMVSKAPALEVRYAKKGIRNMPVGGDWFTQGGVLIFDKQGKLRFVYYETYGKPLDVEAIQWAIEQANKPEVEAAIAA